MYVIYAADIKLMVKRVLLCSKVEYHVNSSTPIVHALKFCFSPKLIEEEYHQVCSGRAYWLTGKSELAKGAEDTSKVRVEGIAREHDGICVDDLDDEGNEGEDDEGVKHLELGVSRSLILLVDAVGGGLEGGHDVLKVGHVRTHELLDLLHYSLLLIYWNFKFSSYN